MAGDCFRQRLGPGNTCQLLVGLSFHKAATLSRSVKMLDQPGKESILSRLAKSPDGHLAHCILGADVPSDQCVTGTMITLKASGESWNCGFSIGGAPGRSAPHVEPCARGK